MSSSPAPASAGLTAALALARARASRDRARAGRRLEETGAGIQLSPNATRVLIALGCRTARGARWSTPQAIRVMAARSGREIARIPLGAEAERPLRRALLGHPSRRPAGGARATRSKPTHDITLKLGIRVEDFAAHANGVSGAGASRPGDDRRGARHRADRRRRHVVERRASGWAAGAAPRFRPPHRLARAGAGRGVRRPNSASPSCICGSGSTRHLVHYPVKGGRADQHRRASSATNGMSRAGAPPASRDEMLRHFARWHLVRGRARTSSRCPSAG